MDAIRLGFVRYLNTCPLVEGLDRLNGATLLPEVPAKLGDLVLSGTADIGLVSLIDVLRSASTLALLPVGMIGCDGPTLTVRLYSKVPFASVRCVHADVESHTSVILSQVILDRTLGVRPKVEAFVRGTDWPETLLLIGDKVVNDAPPAGEYAHEMDLGEAWHSLTGLPFVYAMWACRASDSDDVDSARRIETGAAMLDRQRRHNSTRLDWIVTTRAAEHRWPVELARNYLGRLLRYEVGERERRAVAMFAAEAARLGLVPFGGLVWWDEIARGAKWGNRVEHSIT
jgi:chorismate dehydratase